MTNLARTFLWALLLYITSASTDYSDNFKSAANNSNQIDEKELIFAHIVSEKMDFTRTILTSLSSYCSLYIDFSSW